VCASGVACARLCPVIRACRPAERARRNLRNDAVGGHTACTTLCERTLSASSFACSSFEASVPPDTPSAPFGFELTTIGPAPVPFGVSPKTAEENDVGSPKLMPGVPAAPGDQNSFVVGAFEAVRARPICLPGARKSNSLQDLIISKESRPLNFSKSLPFRI
jgi:hypothetical protein